MAAKNSLSKTFVWILMGLLILGLGGFGVTNLSGMRTNIAEVGETDISMDEYARALQRDIRATEAELSQPLTFAEAQARGIDRQALSQLINGASLDEETRRLGISVGDLTLAREIANIPSFQGVNGEFDRDIYDRALQNIGMKEAEFEDQLRRETSRTVLQSAIVGGATLPEVYVDTLIKFAAQQRDVTWALLERPDLTTGLPDPAEADVQSYYDAHPKRYTAPEQRKITYALLTPEMIVDTVEIDEATLKEAYDERAEQFNQPERRLVERLAFSDLQAAQAARALIDDGGSFEEAVSARGLELSDTDMGDVSEIELGTAGAEIFSAKVGEVIGPIDSDIGPALFRVNGVLEAQNTSLEEAEPALRDELALDRARRVIAGQRDAIDDELAAGATLEDLARDTDMELGTIDWSEDISEGIASYDAFREAAAAAKPDDYPQLGELSDGGLFAIRLDEITPAALRPLDEIRDQVADDWRENELTDALAAQAEELKSELQSGKSFDDLSLSTESAEDVTRTDPIGDGFAGAVDALFEIEESGDYDVVADSGRAMIIRLDAVEEPDLDGDRMAIGLQLTRAQANAGFAADIMQALAQDFRSRVEINIDQSAINAVNTSFR